jgi:hypothetical protein
MEAHNKREEKRKRSVKLIFPQDYPRTENTFAGITYPSFMM